MRESFAQLFLASLTFWLELRDANGGRVRPGFWPQGGRERSGLAWDCRGSTCSGILERGRAKWASGGQGHGEYLIKSGTSFFFFGKVNKKSLRKSGKN